MYDQAKWYVLYFDDWYTYSGDYYKQFYKKLFRISTFVKLLVNDHKICRGTIVNDHKIAIFCGQKKLKKLIIEANLLGLEDSLIIFERKGERKNG